MQQAQKSSGCGCFAGGCTVVLVIFVIVVLFIIGIVYSLYKKALDYTGTAALPIPVHEVAAEKFNELSARMAEFKQSWDANKPASIELSADDINTLIAMSPDLKEAKGKVHVRIEEGLIFVDGSVPLKEVVGFRDRYLNGTASFEVSVMDGKVRLIPQNILLNGRKLPKEFDDELKRYFKEEFQRELEQDPRTRDNLSRIKAIAVERDRLLIHTAPAEGSAGGLVRPAPAPAAVPGPSAGPAVGPKPFTCSRQIAAFDPASPAKEVGHFLPGTQIEILGPAAQPGMSIVRYRSQDGEVTTVLCRNEDLAP